MQIFQSKKKYRENLEKRISQKEKEKKKKRK